MLDAEILADVYFMMTGGQTSMFDDGNSGDRRDVFPKVSSPVRLNARSSGLLVQRATPEELRHMKLTWTILTVSRNEDLSGASRGLLKNPLNRHPTGNPLCECVG
ncbi:MAG: hypothetical protein Ct9H300mP8_07600 [Gammaproteobacteria bacterium]|nr:MAG: hypothetical protein Ct9H300mP8_07600 [Gammaproteobacteria bacterium]